MVIDIGEYVDGVVQLTRQSAAIQEARVSAFLDGATLAAEQVQDVRLNIQEAPAELSGWEFWGEVAVTFLVESNIVGRLLSTVSRRIFTPLVRSNAAFLALPKSYQGKELVKLANLAKRAPRGEIFTGGPNPLTRPDALSGGFADLPGTATKDSLDLYHASIQTIVRFSSSEWLDVGGAVAKSAKQAYEQGSPRENDPLPVTDSAGVAILSHAQDYARATRLAIDIRTARIEFFIRRQASIADLGLITELMRWEPLESPEDASRAALPLSQLRSKYQLICEAMIWARMYGFSVADARVPGSQNVPDILVNQAKFMGVAPPLQDYWTRRFQSAADAYAREKGRAVTAGATADLVRLRAYFAGVASGIEQLGLRKDELSQRSVT